MTVSSPSAMAANPSVLYIGGLGRSGTTLLERLLGQIDGVQTLGETVHLWVRGVRRNESCGCGLPFHECPFWRQVGLTAFGGWSEIDVDAMIAMHDRVDRMRRVPGVVTRPGAEVRRYAGVFRSIYDAARRVTGANVIVDSSKHSSLAYCLRTRDDLDLRVVHVVRDPRAVAFSWAKTVERPEANVEEKFMNRYTPARAAALWNAENGAISALSRLDVPVMRLTYESFVAEPRAALRRVLGFAGMPPDVHVPIEGHRATLRPNHTVSGNPVRLRTGVLDINRDDEWVDGIGARERAVVTAMTSPLRAAYRFGDSRHGR
jgi:Sulfotransferase domain